MPQKIHGKINNSALNEKSQRTRSSDRTSYLVLALSAYDRAQRRLSDPRNLSGSVIATDQKRICTYFTDTLLDSELLPLWVQVLDQRSGDNKIKQPVSSELIEDPGFPHHNKTPFTQSTLVKKILHADDNGIFFPIFQNEFNAKRHVVCPRHPTLRNIPVWDG